MFETIQEKIANQLNYIYGTHENNGVGLEIKVLKIELGISMLSVIDQTDCGIYIPTWYVSYCNKWINEDDYGNADKPNQIMLSAIDGSYIEPRISNAELMEID